MTYTVALLNFEGPLDLLLQLVERSSVDLRDLSLTTLTEQYIDHIAQLENIDPSDAAHFTALAAKLLYLKSRNLIPDNAEQDEQEVQELQRQLEEYSHYRDAAAALAELIGASPRGLPRRQSSQPATPAMPTNLTGQTIAEAYRTALTNLQISEHTVAVPNVSLTDMINRLIASDAATLHDFFSGLDSRAEMAVAFLASLELWRQGRLKLIQNNQFSIIRIDARTSATA